MRACNLANLACFCDSFWGQFSEALQPGIKLHLQAKVLHQQGRSEDNLQHF